MNSVHKVLVIVQHYFIIKHIRKCFNYENSAAVQIQDIVLYFYIN